MRRAAGIALATLMPLLPGAATAQELVEVCVSWGSPLDGTEVVIYTPEDPFGHVEVRSVTWLDEPERGVRHIWGKAPGGAWDRLRAELPDRLATLPPDPPPESCDAGDWRWRIAARFDDGQTLYGEGACFDGPTERLYIEMSGWTDLFRAEHFGAEWVDGRTPATLADHRSCAAPEG